MGSSATSCDASTPAAVSSVTAGTSVTTVSGSVSIINDDIVSTFSGTSDGVWTMALNAVMGAVMAHRSVVSCRRPQPFPKDGVSLALEMTSMGTESA